MPFDPAKLSVESPVLFIIGVPLEEGSEPSWQARSALTRSDFCIGESKNVASRLLRSVGAENKELFLLDHQSEREWRALAIRLREAKEKKQRVSLFSDVGLPILFDPGKRVLDFCRKEGFLIRSVPGPTSWSTACALSGWEPPFLLVGFLPQKKEARRRDLSHWAGEQAHCVFMETPYRFTMFLDELKNGFGRRQAFLAWEIGKADEWLCWDYISEIQRKSEHRSLRKGEFVLLTHKP